MKNKKKQNRTRPSQKGLNHRTRIEIVKKKDDSKDMETFIIDFATKLYEFLLDYIDPAKSSKIFTQHFARFISLVFLFKDYDDESVFLILNKAADRNRKKISGNL